MDSELQKDIDKAILQINQEIRKLKIQKEYLIKYMNNPFLITEKVYHRLCDMPIKKTDTLGIILGYKLGLKYKKRSINSYIYDTEDEEIHIQIPNYQNLCAEIVVNKYYSNNFYEKEKKRFLETIKNKETQIKEIEDCFFKKNLFGRSKFIYKDRYTVSIGNIKIKNVLIKIIKYIVQDPIKNYEKQYRMILADLKMEQKENIKRYKEFRDEYKSAYKKQREIINKYSQMLLGWTNMIYVKDQCQIMESIENYNSKKEKKE